MELKTLTSSKNVRIGVLVVLSVILALVVFQAGVEVGYRRGIFADKFADNYDRMFEGPQGMHGFFEEGIQSGHGAAGSIVSISLPSLVISSNDNTERVVHIATTTQLRNGRDTLQATDLKVGTTIVVLGDPGDDGSINAHLIRTVTQ